jgi:secondary thiamine-phosphate synthase enzyme
MNSLNQWQSELEVSSSGRGFYEITPRLTAFVGEAGVGTGLLSLHIAHTSASLLIQENADPEVRRDLERFFSRLIPDGDRLFRHTCEGEDDMPAHVRTALTTVNLGIPVVGGRLALGTWQGVYLWEHRSVAHKRRVILHLIGK